MDYVRSFRGRFLDKARNLFRSSQCMSLFHAIHRESSASSAFMRLCLSLGFLFFFRGLHEILFLLISILGLTNVVNALCVVTLLVLVGMRFVAHPDFLAGRCGELLEAG